MDKKFGWVYIGCGGIAETTAKQLLKEGSGHIVAVWNRTRQRAERFVKKYGGKVYATPEEAILSPEADGVYIATTADTHAYFAKLAISLGKPVLCEKPFTVNYSQAKEVFDLAEQKGVYVAEAMWTWYNNSAITVKSWIKDNKIGDIKSAKGALVLPLKYLSNCKRLLSPELIGGALMDVGVYPIRYMYELFGMPKKLYCTGKVKGGVDLTERVIMDYTTFKATADVSIEKPRPETLKVKGSLGQIKVPSFHCTKSAYLKAGEKVHFKEDVLLYGQQFKRVAEEITQGRKYSAFCSPKSTLEVMQLLDECRKQLKVTFPCEQQNNSN
jgi:predicted dehydrogenase